MFQTKLEYSNIKITLYSLFISLYKICIFNSNVNETHTNTVCAEISVQFIVHNFLKTSFSMITDLPRTVVSPIDNLYIKYMENYGLTLSSYNPLNIMCCKFNKWNFTCHTHKM